MNWCSEHQELFLVLPEGQEYDKFGRILGDIHDQDGCSLVTDIIANFHGVAYEGQSKEAIKKAHLENRIKVNTI